MKYFTGHCLLVLITALFSLHVQAQYSKDVEGYSIHYVAYNSSFLSSKVAQHYGISRGENIAVINVSVQKTGELGVGVEADVEGLAVNMIQQAKHLKFRKIDEGRAVYYIASFKFDDEDSLTFDLDVKIADRAKSHHLKWQQKFWYK